MAEVGDLGTPSPLKWPRLRDLAADGRGWTLLRTALRHRGPLGRAALRDLAFRLAGNYTPSFAIDVDGVRFHLDTADREVSRIIYIYGLYERPAMAATFEALRRNGGGSDLDGGLLLDLGANIGTATLTAVAHFGAGGGFAFEPDPANFRTMRLNLEANGLADSVRGFQVALSDRTGTVEFERSEMNFGDHRVRVADGARVDDLGEPGREVIEVPATTLDELVAAGEVDLERVALAWIDVQGHEAHLLAGASTLLESPVPVVIELWPYGLRAAGGLDRFLELIGTHYEHFVDLGGPKGEPSTGAQPIAAVAAMPERHPRPDDHTDLLLLPRR